MSISKIHIARFSDDVAKIIFKTLKNKLSKKEFPSFCSCLTNRLNSGLSNDYMMIWDNYSVAGDQISYAYKLFSDNAKSFGEIDSSSWKIAFGYKFMPKSIVGNICKSLPKMHRLIFLNTMKSIPLGSNDLIICLEEIIGPTIHDIELDEIQMKFITSIKS